MAKKYKNVEIVFSIPKAKSGSISIKIRQPSLWTDPYLPDLLPTLWPKIPICAIFDMYGHENFDIT